MKYMIHSCNSRQWYVDKFLVPSMLKQGIKEDDIYVYQDTKEEGNLVSFVVSCHKAYEMWGEQNVWHLQDDVLICSDFKKRTEDLESFDGIVQAFACDYDENIQPGESYVRDNKMWWSFPCIRLSSKITKLFAEWVDIWVWRDNQYGYWVRHKKGDDVIFKIYIESYHKDIRVLKLNPNLVEHVDWLIGGSLVNKQRNKKIIRSMYWEEQSLVDELERSLNK